MHTLRHLTLAASLVLVTGSAVADPAEESFKLNYLLTFGHSFGGATLLKLNYTDGTTQNLKAGGGNYFAVGAQVQMVRYPVDFSLTVGEHVDKDHAVDAEIRYTRVPLEAIGYARLDRRWRAGLGLRYLIKDQLSANVRGTDYGTIKFQNSTGLIVDTDYWFNNNFGLGLRYVKDRVVTADPRLPLDADGSHWAFQLRAKF